MSRIPEPARQELIDWLSSPYGSVKLCIEGRAVIFEQRCYTRSPLTYRIVPFVDGTYRPGWGFSLKGEEELRDQAFARRLMRQRSRQVMSAKELKLTNRLRKYSGKKPMTKEQNRQIYWDVWHCPKALVRHLEKEFETIEIVERDHVAA